MQAAGKSVYSTGVTPETVAAISSGSSLLRLSLDRLLDRLILVREDLLESLQTSQRK